MKKCWLAVYCLSGVTFAQPSDQANISLSVNDCWSVPGQNTEPQTLGIFMGLPDHNNFPKLINKVLLLRFWLFSNNFMI